MPTLKYKDGTDWVPFVGSTDNRVWFGTLAQYAAITVKDPNVLYVIKG